MVNIHQAKVITPQELQKVRRVLPQSWYSAVGILKGKKRVDPLRYQRQVRKEWGVRLKKISGTF